MLVRRELRARVVGKEGRRGQESQGDEREGTHFNLRTEGGSCRQRRSTSDDETSEILIASPTHVIRSQ